MSVQLFIYEKYYLYYSEGTTLKKMIATAQEIGEHSCTLYEEYASVNEPALCGDDLERLFEYGIEERPSLQSLIERHLPEYRHILKFRTALTLDCSPMISVRYILVWKKKKKVLETRYK